MRLSELLKTDFERQVTRPSIPLPPVPAKKVTPPAAKPAPLGPPPAQSSAPVISEAQLRADIEKGFMEKIQSMEAELKKITQDNLKGQEQVFRERQEAIEREKQRLAGEVRDLKNVNEHLAATRESMEQDFERRLTEQKKQFQDQLQKALEEIQRKQSEEMQVKLFQREQEILEKKRLEAEQAQKGISVPAPPPPAAVPAPAPAAEIKKVEPVKLTASDFPAHDPKVEEKLRRMYQALVQTGEQVFQYISRENTVELDFLRKVLSEVLELAEEHDQELLSIVLEPYANPDYFVYHSANCAILSMIVGMEMKLPKEELRELALASFVHDVGLLSIRENLDYPKQLTPEIKTEIMKHPARTVEILGGKISDTLQTAILHHHETLNGKGYPAGLSGEDIHLYARVIHIVDSFEAMTHHRPYRQKSMEVSEALKEMVDRGRGVYDREAMKGLMNRIGLYPLSSLVELSNKQIARVIRQSRKFPLSPVVKIEFDEEGHKLRTSQIIDLSKNQLIHILGPVGTTASYGKERVEKHHSRSDVKKGFRLPDLIPYAIVLLVAAALAFLFMKL